MKNILWVKISGKQYVFAYSHKTGAIQIREGTTRGSVVCSLTNSTSLTSLRQTFLLL